MLTSEEAKLSSQQGPKRLSRFLLRIFLLVVLLMFVVWADGLLVRLPCATPCTAGGRRGAVHIHANGSGAASGPVPEVPAPGRRPKLPFLGTPDHNGAITHQGLADAPADLSIISGEEFRS